MALLNLRQAQTTPLTAAQLDQNFTNLNNELQALVNLSESAAAAEAAALAAAISAAAAAVSAAAALVSENAAAVSETNAAASEASAAASFDAFDDIYLGAKASDPTLDNDGDALQDGALYFNTTTNLLRVYDLGNTVWITGVSTSSGVSAGFVIATVLALGG